MIETKESRAEFEKRREVARAAMRHALKGELPMDVPVAKQVEVVKSVVQPATKLLRNNKKSRAEYFRGYRKREKKCPHCGGKL